MNGIVVSVNLPSNQLYEENFMCVKEYYHAAGILQSCLRMSFS